MISRSWLSSANQGGIISLLLSCQASICENFDIDYSPWVLSVIKKFLFASCLLVLCASVTVAISQAFVGLTAASKPVVPIATLVWPLWFLVCAAFFRSRILLLLGIIALVISLLVLTGLIF